MTFSPRFSDLLFPVDLYDAAGNLLAKAGDVLVSRNVEPLTATERSLRRIGMNRWSIEARYEATIMQLEGKQAGR